jgi:hypothetical protein
MSSIHPIFDEIARLGILRPLGKCPVLADTARHYVEMDSTAAFEEWREIRMEELTEQFMAERSFSDVLADYDPDCTGLDRAWSEINRIRHAARPGDNDYLARRAMVSIMESAAKEWAESEIKRELKAGR